MAGIFALASLLQPNQVLGYRRLNLLIPVYYASDAEFAHDMSHQFADQFLDVYPLP